MALHDVFGSLGFIFSIIISISPAKSVYEGIQNMELKNLTPEYLLAALIKCSLWYIYGLKTGDIYVYYLNEISIICYLFYLNALLYINKKKSEIWFYNLGILIFIIILSTILDASLALIISTIFSTIWQFTTIRNIRKSLNLKDASYINILLAYVSCLGFFVWVIYSILTDNYLMFTPNICGTFMWIVNIIIYYWSVDKIADDNVIIKLLKFIFYVKVKEIENHHPLLSTYNSKSTTRDF